MSDRIAVMNNGEVEQVDEVTDLYEHPRSRFVADFLGETNLFEGSVSRENGHLRLTSEDGDIRIDANGVDAGEMDGRTVTYTVRPESLRIGNGSLETTNSWTGVVENAIYKGSTTLYEVEVGNRLLKAQRQRQQNIRPFEENDEVTVGFDSNEGELIIE